MRRKDFSSIKPHIPGNIDIYNRPIHKNERGQIETVKSISIGEEGTEVLIPTISPEGKALSNREAVDLYRKTKKHLGKFKSISEANSYARDLHKQQDEYYSAK